jgi:hypothetical protein
MYACMCMDWSIAPPVVYQTRSFGSTQIPPLTLTSVNRHVYMYMYACIYSTLLAPFSTQIRPLTLPSVKRHAGCPDRVGARAPHPAHGQTGQCESGDEGDVGCNAAIFGHRGRTSQGTDEPGREVRIHVHICIYIYIYI